VLLEKLLIFDTGIFEKEVAGVLPHLPHLTYLGYKVLFLPLLTFTFILQFPPGFW
jgi:hypothetical protein